MKINSEINTIISRNKFCENIFIDKLKFKGSN
jgi:hypothetical protein